MKPLVLMFLCVNAWMQPRQKAALMQGGSQLHLGNSIGQALQGIQTMGLANLNSQLRPNVAYTQQRIIPAQLRQLSQQSGLTANQV